MCALDPSKPSLVSFCAFDIPFSEKWSGGWGERSQRGSWGCKYYQGDRHYQRMMYPKADQIH